MVKSKKDKKQVVFLLLILGIIFLAINRSNKQVSVSYNYYDKAGNLIGNGRESTVNGVPNIYYVRLITSVKNTGTVALRNIGVTSASPAAVASAYSGVADVVTLAAGATTTITSNLINITQFEGSTVPVSIVIDGQYTTGEGVNSTVTYTGTTNVIVAPDSGSGTTCPDVCSGSNILSIQLISNPNFDSGSAGGWTFYVDTSTASATGELSTAEYYTSPGAYKISINTPSTSHSATQFYTTGLPLISGRQYLLSFKVKSSVPVTSLIGVNLINRSSPYNNFASEPTRYYSATTEWTTLNITFTAIRTSNNARITIYNGKMPAGSYLLLDSFSFKDITGGASCSYNTVTCTYGCREGRCLTAPESTSVCGDNYCTTGEYTSCPADCTNNLCGNGACSGSENKDNCPFDCWVTSADFNPTARNMGAPYHTYDEVKALMNQYMVMYPSLVSSEVIGQSIQGKDIYLYRIGNASGGRFMWDGRAHGPEDCGTETGLEFIKWALTDSSVEAKNVREKNYLLFIPAINVDSTRRQNMRRVYPNGQTSQYGVDLNRNFVTGWGSSGSSDPNNAYEYRGQSAGSEPETQAVRYAMQKYLTTDGYSIYMNTHCGMKLLRYYSNTATTQRVLANVAAISAATGASTLSHYPAGQQSSGGYVMADGATFSGGNGWIHETITWEQLPNNLVDYISIWYKQDFPLWLGMAQAVQR